MIKKEQFLESYLKNKTITATCKELNIARSTAYRLLKDKEVIEEINNIRHDIYADIVDFLRSETLNASETLVNIIKDSKSPQSVKVQAINLFFVSLREFEERIEINSQIEEIKALLNNKSQPQ